MAENKYELQYEPRLTREYKQGFAAGRNEGYREGLRHGIIQGRELERQERERLNALEALAAEQQTEVYQEMLRKAGKPDAKAVAERILDALVEDDRREFAA